jgi:uncharacterized protein YegP (UPF0339 family)
MRTKVELYQDKKREWRWRMWRAGRIVADSAESYKRRAAASRSVARLIGSFIAVKFDIV